jgi:hypothetical protein
MHGIALSLIDLQMTSEGIFHVEFNLVPCARNYV